jgi:formylglycine-generating enzyme required for sulfatase activity
MTQLLLPGEIRPTFWQKTKQTLSALFQPGVYIGLKNAETSSRNTALMIASNQSLEASRQNFRMKELQLQYVQFKERETNLAELEHLRRKTQVSEGQKNRNMQAELAILNCELQRSEGYKNRELQAELGRLNRELQANEGRLSRDFQAQMAEFRSKVDMAIQQKNQQFQAEQAEISREFQAATAELSHERQKELSEFRAKVDFALQEKNLDFQRWSLEQQRELQLQLKSLDAELSRELRAYDRETSLKLIEEKKKSDNSPIWLVASQFVGAAPMQDPVPLRIFFSPPVLPYDRMGKAPDSARGFPEMADFLAEELRQLFRKYSAEARPAEFIYGAWTSNFFHGEAAALSLFDALKTEPTLILEASLEAYAFNLRLGYWGLNCAKHRYQSFLSGLSWEEALNDFAKARALKWYRRKQEWAGAGKPPEEFEKRYGAETVKRFMGNLEILEREQQCIEDGDDPNEIERPYKWHRQDYEDLKQFIAACHCLAAGLITDEYFLTDVPQHVRRPPLLPELLPDILKSVPEREAGALTKLVVSNYRGLYEYLGQTEPCWIPELLLDLALGLTKLPDLSYARAQIVFSVQKWLELHHLPQSQNLEEMLGTMDSALTIADAEYVEKLNRCMAGAGGEWSLNVADACFRRAMNRCRREDYEAAISDFDQAIQLKPAWAEAFYNRGLAYARTNQHQKAVADYTESLRLSPGNANAYNNRANAYYKLGEHQKAIDDYDKALKIKPDLPEAERNRAIAQGVLDEIRRKIAEEEAQRRQEEEQKGREFEFEVVFVNAKGNITSRRKEKACQKIEDLGKGVTLEMVYIPGGTFTMGSPETEAKRGSDEGPQHKVTLSPFFMGKYPVTQKQWETIMGNNPSGFKGANRPVENVSWEDAADFCEKLSQKTGKNYRLPTEAEWEYACRAGTTTPFYFGETITPDLVNYDGKNPYGSAPKGRYREETTDAGSFPPNAFGLYDMHGNVYEWCQDWIGDYPSNPVTDPVGPSSGSYRVGRGGGWLAYAGYCRSADRYRGSPDYRLCSIGFRLVLPPGQQR